MSDAAARQAAVTEALGYVTEHATIGLGSGRAVFALIEAIGERFDPGTIKAVVASPAAQKLATGAGIEMVELTNDVGLGIAFDGADEFDEQLRMIKGGGAALLHEKLIIEAAAEVVIMAEPPKRVERLGSTRLLPVETVRFGWETTQHRLSAIAPSELRLDEGGQPVITADGNYILDADISKVSTDLDTLASEIKGTLGVVDHGLFLQGADRVILGANDGSVEILVR